MATPLISICVPNLNGQPFLEERVQTLLDQTVNDWEIIVCDSYSSDGSWEFFQKFVADKRFQLQQVPKAGVYAGWNDCLKRAHGKYIYIATSDDTCSPDFLEKMIAPLERHPELLLSHCQVACIDESSKPLPARQKQAATVLGEWEHKRSIRSGQAEFIHHAVLGTIWTSITTLLMRRSLFDRIGYFRTDLKSFADNEFAFRASLATDIAYLPEALATWRIHAAQATPKESTWQEFHLFCEALRDVMNDSQAGIPERWRSIPQWQERLLQTKRLESLEYLRLFRWELRKNPGQFFENAQLALRHEPGWLLKQIVRGFGWPSELDTNPAGTVQELRQLFAAPWPPREADARWNLL
jgi:glycosyltransferase involved in cell wall biosynthesis